MEMKKIVGTILLSLCCITPVYADDIEVEAMSVTFAHVDGPFLPPGGFDLNTTATTNLVDDYINGEDAITVTSIGPAGDQILYTSEKNMNLNGMASPAELFPGGPVPIGSVNTLTNVITVDLSSMFANHGPMDQNIGGTAIGTFDSSTGEYTMSWTAILSQGPAAGLPATFTFSGVAILDSDSDEDDEDRYDD
jgi:hypothetical protein